MLHFVPFTCKYYISNLIKHVQMCWTPPTIQDIFFLCGSENVVVFHQSWSRLVSLGMMSGTHTVILGPKITTEKKHILQWWLWKGLSGSRGESNLELFFLNNVLRLVKQCFTPGLRRVLPHHETRLPNFFWHVGEDIQHGRQSSELLLEPEPGGSGRGGPLRLLQGVGRKENEQLRNLDYPNWF